MTEIWKDIKGYEGLYQISNMGRVKSHRRRYPLQCTLHNSGYIVIDLYNPNRKRMRVHRLVAQAFLGLDITDTKMCVCHKDDNPSNNRIDNLFLGTHSENMRDMIAKGRNNKSIGEKHYSSKLTEKDVIDIKNRVKQNESQYKIAEYYGVYQSAINKIANGITWKHIKI